MTLRNTSSTAGKTAVTAVAVVVGLIAVVGLTMMLSALRHGDNDLFMEALAFMMLSATCAIPTWHVMRTFPKECVAKKPQATKESLITRTGKMLAFQHQKEVEQQA